MEADGKIVQFVDLTNLPIANVTGSVCEFPSKLASIGDDWFVQVNKFKGRYYLSIREIKNKTYGKGASISMDKISRLQAALDIMTRHIEENKHLIV